MLFRSGLGNPLMSDDGLGIQVVQALQLKKWPPEVLILEAGTAALSYLGEISQSRRVIAVDAVSSGGLPGSIYRLTPAQILRLPGGWRESHGFTLPETIELARIMTGLPQNMVIFGLEPQNLGPGLGLSPEVQEALPRFIDHIAREIRQLITGNP